MAHFHQHQQIFREGTGLSSNNHLPATIPQLPSLKQTTIMSNFEVPSRLSNPLELFVGNLSYFCEEKDIFALFNDYSTVTNVRIMRTDDQTRSLKYGFVVIANHQELEEICRLLNGHLFMGRCLR